jgi:hypothetical protein
MLTALGTIVHLRAEPHEAQFYCGLLDYYDHWQTIDLRLLKHHKHLSQAADSFGHEIVYIATYSHLLLDWVRPERISLDESVVIAGAMAKSLMISVRSACDAIALALSYVACNKPGQVPFSSLVSLVRWAERNPGRICPSIASLLSEPLDWFWNIRSLRDHVVHGGAQANIHCDRKQFNLWIHSPKSGWVTRQPLFPLLAKSIQDLTAFSNRAAKAINLRIDMPVDRIRSRVVEGIHIPAIHKLLRIADDYAAPSP